MARTTERPPKELFNRLYYDTAVFDAVALARLIEDVGPDHVLVGTDFPFDLADWDPVGSVAAVSLSDEARGLVLGHSAVKLLGIAVNLGSVTQRFRLKDNPDEGTA